MVLVAACTAVVTTLLLVTISIALLPTYPDEMLSDLIRDPGVRGGTAFAIVLLTLPSLLLLDQSVRLGTAARERRLAALRLAGATPSEVRRLGGLEVGIPAFVGAVLGIGLYRVLRIVIGGVSYFDPPGSGLVIVRTSTWGVFGVHLVPTSVAPTWWQLLLTVAAVTLLGVVVGSRASARVVVTPLGVTRQQTAPPPRPWGVLLLVAAALSVPVLVSSDFGSTLVGIVAVALAVLGIIGLAPWLAYRVGRYVEPRATSGPMLLAARRLVCDPRPTGRAAAAVGAIGLVSGGAGVFLAAAVDEHLDAFYLSPVLLVGIALLGALLVVMGTLAVHSVESLLDRKRSVAALGAMGATVDELERSQRYEALLVAVPMAVLGTVLGTVAMAWVAGGRAGVVVLLPNIALSAVLVWLAAAIATRLTRPWAAQAASPAHLRTP